MELNHLAEGLLRWLGLVILFTFHEFGHAWMAMKCGDDTAKEEGRVSLNPLVHIDPIGTVLIPLIMAISGAGLIGWAKPVPVNPNNLNNPRRDDILVTLAGPWMNLVLAVVFVGLERIGWEFQVQPMAVFCREVAALSLLLFFFNLLPVPPLDGSQILRVVVGMSYDAYLQLARFGFIALILLMRVQPVWDLLYFLTKSSYLMIARMFGM